MIYGYMRVSRTTQEFDRQIFALDKYAADNNINYDLPYFKDKASGKNFDRPEYERLKGIITAGDTLIIKEVDRLGRDWDMTAQEWRYFLDNGINIVVIDTPILNTGGGGQSLDDRFVKEQIFTLLLYLAQKEREKISQRTKEALKAKQAQGVRLGRPEVVDRAAVIELYKSGMRYNDIIKTLGIARGTLAAIVKQAAAAGVLEARSGQA